MAYYDPAEKITETILAAIQSGETGKDWTLPWHRSGFDIPINAVTRKEYKGINTLSFAIMQICNKYPTAIWATYKQWESLGAYVKRGEHPTLGMYYDRKTRKNADGEDELVMFAKGFQVFNAAQVNGWTHEELPKSNIERDTKADSIIAATRANIVYGGDNACYSPSLDTIKLPSVEQFKNKEGFYSTSFHELSHWTGHKDRLNRDLSKRFGSDAYAFEELVADLSAAFTCATLGIHSELPADHIKYVACWATRLKADKKALYKAASEAQKARDYILAFSAD